MAKYKLTWKDLTWSDFKIYLFALFKAFIPKKKIKNLDDLENFIQTKSAWVTQVTLYGYLKTRMGTRYVLHFENDEFMTSVNLAKWNIYAVSLQDLTLFTFSYLKAHYHYNEINNVKEIFLFFNSLFFEFNFFILLIRYLLGSEIYFFQLRSFVITLIIIINAFILISSNDF